MLNFRTIDIVYACKYEIKRKQRKTVSKTFYFLLNLVQFYSCFTKYTTKVTTRSQQYCLIG